MSAAAVIAVPSVHAETRGASSAVAKMQAITGWIETPTAARVSAALSYAHAAGDIVLIAGNGGVGKTFTATHYAAANRNCWMVTMTPAATDVVPVLQVIAEAVKSTYANGANALHNAIVAAIVDKPHGLLVVDEAQCMGNTALDQLRAIHDATGVGMALVGNRDLYSRLNAGESAAVLDAVRERIGKRLSVANASAEDVGAILNACGMTNAKLRKVLTDAGTKAGGLRIVRKALHLAGLLAERGGQALSETHVRQAWQELGVGSRMQ